MRDRGPHGASHRRLLASSLLCCALALPLTASAAPGTTQPAGTLPSVSIELPRDAAGNPDSWTKPPLIAQLVPQGEGVVWYRFGAGPGPWQRSFGYVVVPEGKQLLSAVLVAPDGLAGPVTQVVTRTDAHATDAGTSPGTAGASQATYVGAPVTSGSVAVRVVIGPRQLGAVVRRLAGANRYGTAAAISASEFVSAPTVVLATGEKFPDALTASGLAGALDAPVLLLHRTSVPAETKAELRRLGTRHAIICGGTPSVDMYTEKQLRAMGISTERLAGKTRFETAIAVSKRIQAITGTTGRVFIVRGDAFPDALIISPLAYSQRSPILLSPTNKLWPTTAARLSAAHYKSAVVVGGAMSQRTMNGIRNRIGAVDSWAGGDPYDTAVEVAAHEVLTGALSWKYVGIARGDIFPDALCGGAIAGKHGGVILLTPSSALAPEVANALSAHTADIQLCDIYGSNIAVGDAIKSQIESLLH
ncbi:MAG: cell wall-binding repeat-containing protein [Coriobacteriia bacterium]|nr:cell wall-binding repeat-containing protein [Coriobacteriia bacterium]